MSSLLTTFLRRAAYLRAVPFLFAAYGVGVYFDRIETLQMTRFRGKSKLYGREYGPDEQPPWP